MELTDAARDLDNDAGYLHDCIYVSSTRTRDTEPYQSIPYCLTEATMNDDRENMTAGEIFTFEQLEARLITGEQLYRWSAPIDVIERYQSYLNERSTALGQQLYYNCTIPRFGPQCQFSLDVYDADDPSLAAMVAEFYRHSYEPTELTCYVHLKCVHATTRTCLDWSDVCDDFVDCQNGVDEALCWQLTSTSTCDEDEWHCRNGQCIPMVFHDDSPDNYECLDGSDGRRSLVGFMHATTADFPREPSFRYEDLACPRSWNLFSDSTSSCQSKRLTLLQDRLFAERPSSVSGNCWQAVSCRLRLPGMSLLDCNALCSDRSCEQWIAETCTEIWNVPAGTVAFGHIFFLYTRAAFSNYPTRVQVPPDYICYDPQLCDGLPSGKPLLSFHNATCRKPQDFPVEFTNAALARGHWYTMFVVPIYKQLHQCNKINSSIAFKCDPLNMYQCKNSSRCIPQTRICDRTLDCPYDDDEDCTPVNDTCAMYSPTQLFHCVITHRCLSAVLVGNELCDCRVDRYDYCEDEFFHAKAFKKQLSFPTICDGYTELIPTIINGREETDETECGGWECDNIYTHCDGFWNCPNGADELDCPTPWSSLNCSARHHLCVSPNTTEFICLGIEKANDGVPDCLGGTDEPRLCDSIGYERWDTNFYCIYSKDELCVSQGTLCRYPTCKDRTDAQFCTNDNFHSGDFLCADDYTGARTNVQSYFCKRKNAQQKAQTVHFALEGQQTLVSAAPKKVYIPRLYEQVCHRGLVVHLWPNKTVVCMCPPSYYGDRCQYQNQRVSLTLQLDALSIYRRTPFILVITLMDDSDERTIHSHRQLNYLYIHDCHRRINLYLVYSTRPKNATRNYFIHIDAYERTTLEYRGSLLIPVKHSFMPVNRLAVHLHIIRSSLVRRDCANLRCQHGRCVQYADNADQTVFCRCEEGWSGKYCHLQDECRCSSDSICVGVSADNRSICVCPLDKWGPRCLLPSLACRSERDDVCHDRGQCVPNEQTSDQSDPFTCICRRGFSGKRCEIEDYQLIILFQQDIDVPQTILVHFIQVTNSAAPEIGTTFKNVLTDQHSISVSWAHPWHLAFLDLFEQNYYLIVTRPVYNRSLTITRTISPLDRCRHVRELLHESLARLPLLRRIKHYHAVCRSSPTHLSCFFDEQHLCLCQDYNQRRLANCLEFNHTVQRDCAGQSYCENGAQCLQDRLICPQLSVCVCPKCFYGIQCQFSSNGFDLSLDGILGYNIRPHASFSQQSVLIKVSVALTMIVVICGLVNGILSATTFLNSESHKAGSGIYLMIASLNTIFTMVVLGLKFWFLIVTQISYVTNQPFLYVQCLSLDLLVKIGLSLDQWLIACVSTERALATVRGSKFDRKASKQTAKYIIAALAVIIIGTLIQDPVHRRLLIENDDNVDQKRIWCIVQYSNTLRQYNSAILMLHFIAPILINFFATVVIIVKTAQQRMHVQSNRSQTYREVLRAQARQLRHLLIAPVVFITLAVPRLIISFTSGCLKSGITTWVLLIGYLISFLPLTCTFLVFVYSSRTYTEIFKKTLRQYQR